MKEKFLNLNVFFKSFIISLAISIILLIFTIPFFFFELKDIPLGLFMGQFLSYIFILINGILEVKNPSRNKKFSLILFIILRLVIIGGFLFLSAYLYYRLDVKLFNVFAVSGGYLIPLIVLIIVILKDGR